MKCPHCGEESAEGAHFCEACGKQLVKMEGPLYVCGCGFGNGMPDESGYCTECGMKCVYTQPERSVESPAESLGLASDIGKRHRANEDAGVVCTGEGTTVMVVADGVSTAPQGAKASFVAVKAASKVLSDYDCRSAPAEVMKNAVMAAHEAVLALSAGQHVTDEERTPETTIVAALVSDGHVTVGWVGDSRAYFVGADEEQHLTVDDSWIEAIVTAGRMTRDEANADPNAHAILESLGMRDDTPVPHVAEFEIPQGQLLLLCSDGLWNYFQNDGELAGAIKSCADGKSAAGICECLTGMANDKGGHDNITVAILSR